MPRYTPATIEPKWQAYWETHQTFATPRAPQGPKLYALDMFPYPSGDGLHVGHPEGYTATDIVCRYRRACGYSVMHPMGWDAFGLPAEQHAKKTGTHPRTTTEKNIGTFRRQLKMLGFSYDWSRELATTDVGYFRWTQFIFLVLFDTWFDSAQQRGRPIAELPIPDDVSAKGNDAIEAYRDEHRLAYQIKAPVNWCPNLGTVLANEEVIGGVSERGGHTVVRIALRQWMLRITAYADRLERDLEGLDWSSGIKKLQCDWIGRSSGAEVDFYIGAENGQDCMPTGQAYDKWLSDRRQITFPPRPDDQVLRIYTTRPDTLYGATYMVIAPEHPYVDWLTSTEQSQAISDYCEMAARKSDLDRTELAKDKTGVFTGSYAINPVTRKPIPIWVADYVLISYGTGAIMAVPAHDERDFEFAQKFGLPIVPVVMPDDAWLKAHVKVDDLTSRKQAYLNQAGKLPEVFVGQGKAINSGELDGLGTSDAISKIISILAGKGIAHQAVNYKLRDWLFSRQHFWGEPFPILHELDAGGQPNGRIRALKPEDLPLDLPEKMTFDAAHDRPEPPLDKAPASWLNVELDGKHYRRETNTMPQWAGSCWYYLRFLDPKNDKALVDPELEKAWMPVDLYVGGAEHAVLHLLYSRFWHKVLFDRGYVSQNEPFHKLVNQGMILGEPKYFQKKVAEEELSEVPSDQVEIRDNGAYLTGTNMKLQAVAEKMSKSRGNVINPDKVVEEFGADSLRLFEMFMGPLEAVKPWSTKGVIGVRSFLDRVWRMIVDDRAEANQLLPIVKDVAPTPEQDRVLHKTIAAVTRDIEQLSFNTAIPRMMEFTNFFFKEAVRPKSAMQCFVQLLAPFAPHIAEELWETLGGEKTLAYEHWPKYDESLLRDDSVEIPVQINGKLRGKIVVPTGLDAVATEAAARAEEKIAELLVGKTVLKTIVVPGRMVNFVVK